MNTWIKKSIELANKFGYMDAIMDVYPFKISERRPIPITCKNELRKLFDDGKNIELLLKLLELKKFPIDHPYVGFFKAEHKNSRKILLENNPLAFNKIIDILRSQTRENKAGFDAMIIGSEEPIAMNRQIGPLFGYYIKDLCTKHNYSYLDEKEFKKSTEGIAILNAGDKKAKQFAEENLEYTINKGLDIVAKVNEKYVIGEAKWIGTPGGNQDKSGNDAFGLVDGYNSDNVIPINILDGYVWLDNLKNSKTPKTIREKDKHILSALLLNEFFESLR
jgi:hypothetical protein